jgi:hypothetical protein
MCLAFCNCDRQLTQICLPPPPRPSSKTTNHNTHTHTHTRNQGSLCWGPICRDVHRKKHDILNGALSGAMIRNVHFDELPYLMEMMEEQGLDVANAWKVRGGR